MSVYLKNAEPSSIKQGAESFPMLDPSPQKSGVSHGPIAPPPSYSGSPSSPAPIRVPVQSVNPLFLRFADDAYSYSRDVLDISRPAVEASPSKATIDPIMKDHKGEGSIHDKPSLGDR